VRLRAAPGRQRFGPAVATFDRRVDDLLEPVRAHRGLRLIFNVASEAGDFSMIWHVVSLTRGIVQRRPRQVVVLAIALGVESLIVNQGIKRIFRRERPTAEGDPRYHVRRPMTSSFPSGHASAGAFSATVLTGWDGPRTAPLWYGLGGMVGVSRAVVRIHHASDVVGGMVVGTAMGMVARRVLRRWA
jgi:membrane-associated phospholipid phosphatase